MGAQKIILTVEFDGEDEGYASAEKEAISFLSHFKYKNALFDIMYNLSSRVNELNECPEALDVYQAISNLFDDYGITEEDVA